MNNRFKIRSFGQCAQFNGTDATIDVSDDSSLDFTTDFTIGVWVNMPPTTGSGYNAFINKGSNESYELDFDQGNQQFRFVINTSAGYQTRGTGAGSAAQYFGKWILLGGSLNSSNLQQMYLNASVIDSATVGGSGATPNNDALGIGYRGPANNDRYSPARQDQVFIYSRSLALAEWQQIYYTGVFPQSGLVSLWELDGDSTDSVGNNNGTAANVTWSSDVLLSNRPVATGRVAAVNRILTT